MSIADALVATEADAIEALAKVKAGVAVSAHDMTTVTDWCSWETSNMHDAIKVLVPGSAAMTIQTDLAAAQLALNAAGSNALSAMERYVAVKKAEIAVAQLAIAVLA
jgi:4-alpha-glucanotransferase